MGQVNVKYLHVPALDFDLHTQDLRFQVFLVQDYGCFVVHFYHVFLLLDYQVHLKVSLLVGYFIQLVLSLLLRFVKIFLIFDLHFQSNLLLLQIPVEHIRTALTYRALLVGRGLFLRLLYTFLAVF
ncbi:hypothetical protein [Neorickettsia sp. 179522]|uniref:hypothetical protein n=1 Tax=Neorickettsia sp. 179522 TaxID=1714371 RepID=UPI0012E70C1D|nr:hypothetical protein [Neorickettsia sp. 179522]